MLLTRKPGWTMVCDENTPFFLQPRWFISTEQKPLPRFRSPVTCFFHPPTAAAAITYARFNYKGSLEITQESTSYCTHTSRALRMFTPSNPPPPFLGLVTVHLGLGVVFAIRTKDRHGKMLLSALANLNSDWLLRLP